MHQHRSVAIWTQNLRKEYQTSGSKATVAVAGIDLTIHRSEIYALLGPNGAGKTTTISMLTTLITPSSGQATVAGYDVVSESAMVRRNIGLTFQEVTLDQELTGRQILDFHGRLYGLGRQLRDTRIAEMADLVDLTDVLQRRVATYSGGMKRRLELARGLMTAPQILFLDEPTQGLDPQNRAGIWRYIRELRQSQGLTLLLTTHDMEEAETLADRVGIVDHGSLIIEGAPEQLTRDLGSDMIKVSGQGNLQAFYDAAAEQPYISTYKIAAQDGPATSIQIGVDNGDQRLPQLFALAAQVGLQISAVLVSRPSLGDVFLTHTGRQLRDQ